MRRQRWILGTAVLMSVLLAQTPASAGAVPHLRAPIETCAHGGPECVVATIAEMRDRFGLLGRRCEHHAAFALAYLRTTQTYRWARDQPGFFADTAWVNHEDAGVRGAGLDPATMMQLIATWREQAWQNAVRLATAPSPFARALVALDIEAAAAAQATFLRTLTSYLPPFTTTGPRDAHCVAHNADAPPTAYPFGLPSAY